MSFFSRKKLHKGKVFQTGNFIMQPLTADLDSKQESITKDLVNIFSNSAVIRFNSNLYISNKEQAVRFVLSTLNDYEKEIGFKYFVFKKTNHELIGTIHLIPPKSVKKLYPILAAWPSVKDRIDKLWMIEFYLDANYWGNGIMSLFVKTIIDELYLQGAETTIALSDESNKASIALLKKLEFRKDSQYKDLQNQHLWLSYRSEFFHLMQKFRQ